MTATRSAPRRAPALRPDRSPRPPLRLVEDRPPARPRALVRVATVLAGVLAVAGLFVVVCLHVLLTQGQAELDGLRARAEAEAARNRRLRVQVAELESPSRIVSAARERLGMVPPPTVVYLPAADPTAPLPPVPSPPLAPPPTAAPAAETSTPTTGRPATSTTIPGAAGASSGARR